MKPITKEQRHAEGIRLAGLMYDNGETPLAIRQAAKDEPDRIIGLSMADQADDFERQEHNRDTQ